MWRRREKEDERKRTLRCWFDFLELEVDKVLGIEGALVRDSGLDGSSGGGRGRYNRRAQQHLLVQVEVEGRTTAAVPCTQQLGQVKDVALEYNLETIGDLLGRVSRLDPSSRVHRTPKERKERSESMDFGRRLRIHS